jgi:hypothetical protein
MSDVLERWHEYRCVECDPEYDSDSGHERTFVLLVPEDEDTPDLCPRCGSFRSLMWVNGVREVRPRGVYAKGGE